MKEYLKRLIKYIMYGVPEVEVVANIVCVNDNEKLKGKKILVTGGGKGIGYAIAKKCIESGAEVVIVGRNYETLSNTQKKLGSRCLFYTCDLECDDAVEQLMQMIKENNIDTLINNAGISLHEGNAFNVTKEGFKKQFKVNLEIPYFLSIKFVEYLNSKKTQGCIINIVSERGLYCDDLPYGLTKSALISFTRGFARRTINDLIRVNAIAPGITTTEMTGRKATENLENNYISGGRVFLPEEVAELTAFLVSDAASSISGEVVACDRGNYLRCDW